MMDAILLAGGSANPADPLYSLSAGKPKALVPIAGRPMAQWVIDALAGSKSIDRLIVVGSGPDCGLDFPKATIFLQDSGSLLGNAHAGLVASTSGGSSSELAMLVAADIPAMTPDMVDWIADQTSNNLADLYYCAIDRAVMERQYGGSGRTYIRFRDRVVCGGDAVVVRAEALTSDGAVWKRLTEGRKSYLKMAAAIGLDMVLLMLFQRLSVADTARKASARLGIRGMVLDCPYAEVGMDIDKPFQFGIVERDLLDRAGRSAKAS